MYAPCPSLLSRRPLALALALCITTPALAQQQPDGAAVQLDAVNVRGERADAATTLSGFGATSLLDAPASIAVIERQQLLDRQARVLSEVLRADASAGDAYAPIGYYENFALRGYSLNAANSYRINGLSAVGEQSIALENKQQVQILKGLAGLQSGVNEPAGLIDYRTKRPEHVRSVTLGTDEQGSRYIAADLGDWFDADRTLGVRVNAAREDFRSYVDHADGYRNFLSLAGDWKPTAQSLLQVDVEYQHRQQRSVPGYQLLGGTQVPRNIDVHRLLGYQPWSRPVEMDSLNAQLRYAYQFNETWRASVEASRSRSTINDFSAFAWGCYGAASCADIATPNFFSAQGEYDVYDYRSPDDTRVHDQLRASLDGRVTTGALDHQLSIGADWLRRTIDRYGSVNEFVGSGSIDRDPEVFAQTDVALDPKQRRLDSRQRAVVLADRIGLGAQWELALGARYVRLDERAFDRDGVLERRTRKDALLPQAALLFKPQQQVTVYASYAKSLAAGGTAPWFADNADEILPPTNAYQLETGAKWQLQGVRLGAAVFDIRQAYQFTQPQADGGLLYVQQGRLHNRGLELSADGAVTGQLQLFASVAAIRARAEDTGIAAYEGHQAINVPKLRASVQADYRIPGIDGLALLAGVQYSGRKFADRLGGASVPAYAVANLGTRYATTLGGLATTWRLNVDNVFDKRYWRDAGEYQGDAYLFPGAPRTARLTVQVDF
ncbi:TonB-dependent siderophore receptor [Xanthomonas campestris pv. raphani]|uniref:TonB-dependent receptor n=1 Tax=Xanthomonas campestris TaxID=339 RepID=UPI002B230105|nr:TonB-dependent siderophore receptor [Xanthomonas campestris]MEA9860044.1 TonB-dependent siderophore receptor [Xanthomonas campestris pv. raphani]MEA9940617.1 TonB-dependent siderophore receptor [Xanthomonas campestris pv. raphani]